MGNGERCLEIKFALGRWNGTVDVENFCTGGATVSVRDGTQTGSMSLGESTWVEGEASLEVMKDAAFNTSEQGGWVYVEILPLGAGAGKPVFDLIIDVRRWEMTIPSKGVITVTHELNVLEGPTEGELSA